MCYWIRYIYIPTKCYWNHDVGYEYKKMQNLTHWDLRPCKVRLEVCCIRRAPLTSLQHRCSEVSGDLYRLQCAIPHVSESTALMVISPSYSIQVRMSMCTCILCLQSVFRGLRFIERPFNYGERYQPNTSRPTSLQIHRIISLMHGTLKKEELVLNTRVRLPKPILQPYQILVQIFRMAPRWGHQLPRFLCLVGKVCFENRTTILVGRV